MLLLKVAVFSSLGLLTTQILYYGALLGIGALIGNFLGKLILNHLRVSWFKLVVQLFLLGSGSLMLIRLIYGH